jgi:tRNA(Ile)-lysidine synthase TilS/MesJ
MSKAQVKRYAEQHDLKWREDTTNRDSRYTRNRIRHLITGTLDDKKRQEITGLLHSIDVQNAAIEEVIGEYLASQPPDSLDKARLNSLPESEASEIVANWLRLNGVGFDRKAIARIIEGVKTLRSGAQIDIQQNSYCDVSKDRITLKRR